MVNADDSLSPCPPLPTRRAALFESLEPRRLMHGDDGHGGGDGDGGDDGHHGDEGLDPAIVESVRKSVLAGEDVLGYVGTEYDPHEIGVPTDDPRIEVPLGGGNGGESRGEDAGLVGVALPDMIPWTGPSGYNYYRDTQIDTTSIPGRRLLRFSTAIANAGSGPVELRGGAVNPDGSQKVYQRLYNYNDVTRQYTAAEDRLAGNFIYHPGHNHLHFEGYAEYKLLSNDGGQPGAVATRADGTSVLGEKVGFCLLNITTYDSSIPGYSTSPGGYGCGLLQGISTGRADVYTSSLDSQWVDVTGVPAGNYFLQVTLDAGNAVLESNEDNNTITVPVTISAGGSTATGIQPDRFDNIALNNTFETATDFGELGSRTEASLTLHASYDDDFYRFVATSDGPLNVTMPSSGGDPNLYLYDADRHELARSTRSSGTESVNANVVDGQAYYIKVANFQYTDALVNNYSLQIKGPLPKVTPAFTQRNVVEGRQTTLRVRRNGPITTPVTAGLQFGGTATFGVDYTVDTQVASFGADASEVLVNIRTLSDGVREGEESIEVSLAGSSAYVSGPAAVVYINERVLSLVPASPDDLVRAVGVFRPAATGRAVGLFPSPFADTLLTDDGLEPIGSAA